MSILACSNSLVQRSLTPYAMIVSGAIADIDTIPFAKFAPSEVRGVTEGESRPLPIAQIVRSVGERFLQNLGVERIPNSQRPLGLNSYVWRHS